MERKHCKVFPYGRLDMGKHTDCSNDGPTAKYSMLELWEMDATDVEIFQWCREQIKKERERIEAEVRAKFGKLFDVTDEQIEQAARNKSVAELQELLNKQLRVRKPSPNPIYTQYAEVVFKKRDLLYMASGNYVCTNGPVYKAITGGERPIRCHDRGETQEMYDALCKLIMKKENNHWQVSCFVYYMANAWCKEEAIRIFGENMGNHFYGKWVSAMERGRSADYATLNLYYNMSNHYREDLVSAAIAHYEDGEWMDGQ